MERRGRSGTQQFCELTKQELISGGRGFSKVVPARDQTGSLAGFFFLHVEEAEAGQSARFEQPLVDELLVGLFDLRSRNFSAVGGEFAIGGGADPQESVVRG